MALNLPLALTKTGEVWRSSALVRLATFTSLGRLDSTSPVRSWPLLSMPWKVTDPGVVAMASAARCANEMLPLRRSLRSMMTFGASVPTLPAILSVTSRPTMLAVPSPIVVGAGATADWSMADASWAADQPKFATSACSPAGGGVVPAAFSS